MRRGVRAGGIGLREAPAPGEHNRVESRLIELACPRYGHFDLGTGYHGDMWLDLDRLFLRPALLRPHVRVLADRLREHRVDAVCGPAEGGAFLAYALADLLEVVFLPAYRAPASEAGAGSAYRLAGAGARGGGVGPSLMTRLTRGRRCGPAPGSCVSMERSSWPSRPCWRSGRPSRSWRRRWGCLSTRSTRCRAGRGCPRIARCAPTACR